MIDGMKARIAGTDLRQRLTYARQWENLPYLGLISICGHEFLIWLLLNKIGPTGA
jgi:hypothetical protein